MELKDLKGNCPHCHNHCPLSSPNCGRGMAEAEALLAQAASVPAPVEFTAEEERALIQKFDSCSELLALLKIFDPGKIRVMSLLLVAGPQTQSSMSDRCNIRYPYMGEILFELEKIGFLQKERGESKKENLFRLSEKGIEAAKLAVSNSTLSSLTLFSVLDNKEKIQLTELLTKLLEGWESNHGSVYATEWQKEFERTGK